MCGGRKGGRTAPRQLDKVQLLALLGPRDVRGDEGVHERLEVGAPPLCQRVADLPLVVDALAGELRANRRQALVEPGLEALDLVIFRAQVVAGAVGVSIAYVGVSSERTA